MEEEKDQGKEKETRRGRWHRKERREGARSSTAELADVTREMGAKEL
jgi:hypothetical protein